MQRASPRPATPTRLHGAEASDQRVDPGGRQSGCVIVPSTRHEMASRCQTLEVGSLCGVEVGNQANAGAEQAEAVVAHRGRRAVGAAAGGRHVGSSAALAARWDVLRGPLDPPRCPARCTSPLRRVPGSSSRTRAGPSRGPSPGRAVTTALEHAAYDHLDGAPHLRRYVTKALVMHLADTVWSATERHLFRDARGKTHGLPGTSRWHEFTRIPGRARSHTSPRKWETFRLHGSLAGHRAAYTGSDGVFAQPRTRFSADRSRHRHSP